MATIADLLRAQFPKDKAGASIDLKRPIVFDFNGVEPHTELSMTATGDELGLPNAKALYNVPTIYDGKILDPNTFDGMNAIRKNVMNSLEKPKAYSNEKDAVKDAIARSQEIGELRGDELRRAVLMQYINTLK